MHFHCSEIHKTNRQDCTRTAKLMTCLEHTYKQYVKIGEPIQSNDILATEVPPTLTHFDGDFPDGPRCIITYRYKLWI